MIRGWGTRIPHAARRSQEVKYIHTHTYTPIHTHTHIHTYTHAYTHTYTHAHTCIHTYIHTCTHMHTHIHTHAHTYTRTHTHTYTHTHVNKGEGRTAGQEESQRSLSRDGWRRVRSGWSPQTPTLGGVAAGPKGWCPSAFVRIRTRLPLGRHPHVSTGPKEQKSYGKKKASLSPGAAA